MLTAKVLSNKGIATIRRKLEPNRILRLRNRRPRKCEAITRETQEDVRQLVRERFTALVFWVQEAYRHINNTGVSSVNIPSNHVKCKE